MPPKYADGMGNSVDPDQAAQQSDLGPHCLPICLNDHRQIWQQYGDFTKTRICYKMEYEKYGRYVALFILW